MAQSPEMKRKGQQLASIIGPRKPGVVYRDADGHVVKVERVIVEWDKVVGDVTYVLGIRYLAPSCCGYDDLPIQWVSTPWNHLHDEILAGPELPYDVVNVYDTGRAYGGAEEGGWWYTWERPVASFTPKNGKTAEELLVEIQAKYESTKYSYGEYGYRVVVENHRPQKDFFRPHYC